MLLCAVLVALGSPWSHELLLEWWPHDQALWLLYRSLFVPRWSLAEQAGRLESGMPWQDDVGPVGLLLGIVLLVPRLVGRAPAAGGVRWAAALGTGELVSVLSTLLWWAVAVLTGPGSSVLLRTAPSEALVPFLFDALVFGLVLGLLIGVVYAGAPAAPGSGRGAPTAFRTRIRERSTAMADPTASVTEPVATGTTPGDITRYLSAGAYLDPAFARRVVDGVLGDRLGAVAVSPGVDLVPVARHAFAARRLHRRRDRRLAAALGLVLAAAPLWVFAAPFALRVLGAAATPRASRRVARGRGVPLTSEVAWRLAGTAFGLVVAGVLVGAGLSAVPLPGALGWLVGGYLLGVPAVLAVTAACALALRALLDEETEIDARLAGPLRRGVFDAARLPDAGAVEPWAAAGIAAVAEAQRGNVTCHSTFSPFIGYGGQESAWDLTVPLLPARPGAGPSGDGGGGAPAAVAAFDAWDVLERLRSGLRATAAVTVAAAGAGATATAGADAGGSGGAGGTGDVVGAGGAGSVAGTGRAAGGVGTDGAVGTGGAGTGGVTGTDGVAGRVGGAGDGAPYPAGLRVEHRVFVSGRELVAGSPLLPDPLRAPATRLPDEALRRIAGRPDGVARLWLATHLPLWGGEVVPSHFVHAAVTDRTLHLRCERFVLDPAPAGFHVMDLLPPDARRGAAAAAGDRRRLLALQAVRRGAGALRRAPRAFLADVVAERRRAGALRRELRAAAEDPAFDRGARMSVREAGTGPVYSHHFQRLDAQRTLNALDRHALAAVRDFLDEHGVDTSDFRAQSQTILNHGVLQTGGVSVVGNQAVGPGARAEARSATASAGGPPGPGGPPNR
ncbi:hypothetical protein [Streptomyces sp. NPDC101132]|uniref:hypothetical protein n=1 Tax=Streptomyces sp. NPDC101132 TaxID=3366110 RepID=UPI00382A39AD